MSHLQSSKAGTHRFAVESFAELLSPDAATGGAGVAAIPFGVREALTELRS